MSLPLPKKMCFWTISCNKLTYVGNRLDDFATCINIRKLGSGQDCTWLHTSEIKTCSEVSFLVIISQYFGQNMLKFAYYLPLLIMH